MSWSRLLTTLALAAVLFSPFAQVARAAVADTCSLMSAGSSPANLGDVSVTIACSNAVTAATLALIPVTDPSAPPVDFALTETSSVNNGGAQPYYSTWEVASPITPQQLPPDSYDITMDVTFQDASTGSFSQFVLRYLDQPQYTVSLDRTQIGYDYPAAITVTGNVQVQAPDGTVAPFADGTVGIGGSALSALVKVTTDSQGNFTAQISPAIPKTGAALVKVTALANSVAAVSDVIGLDKVVDPLKLSARLSHPVIPGGQQEVVTGTLRYLPEDTGSAYQPLPGEPILVYTYKGSEEIKGTGTTRPDGSFSITVPTRGLNSSTWQVEAGGAGGDRRFTPTTVGLAMTIELPTAITGFTVKLNPDWTVNYGGCLTLAEPVNGGSIASVSGLTLQYSIGKAGPWHTLVNSMKPHGQCGTNGISVKGTTVAQLSGAYYRLAVPKGTQRGRVYLASTSKTVLAWKYDDRIAGFSVSPTTVRDKGKITVKGQLEYYTNYTWHAFAGQTIYILFNQQGSSTWYWVVKVKTNASGKFSATVADQVGNATWSAYYAGSATHLAAEPPGVYVRVKG